jgi:hypothetical protein
LPDEKTTARTIKKQVMYPHGYPAFMGTSDELGTIAIGSPPAEKQNKSTDKHKCLSIQFICFFYSLILS